MQKLRFKVYVPVFNEEKAIQPLAGQFDLLREALAGIGVVLEVRFVDDASTDGTAQELRKAGKGRPYWGVVRHPQNRGLKGVLETVLALESGSHPPKGHLGIGLLDGDNTHPPMTFFPMVLKLMQGFDVVVASRFQPGSFVEGLSFPRRAYSWMASWLYRCSWRIPNLRDYTCGFRAYRADLFWKASGFKFKSQSFASMAEFLRPFHRAGAIFGEVPFCLRYDLKKGRSKMKLLRTILESLRLLAGR